MSYKITKRTKSLAKKLGVEVKLSRRKGKKIDVIKKGQKVASIGALGYKDYPTYILLEQSGEVPPGTAVKQQKKYKKRHQANRTKRYTPGWYSDKLLWS